MLDSGGQALVALVFILLLIGAAKALAQKIILPILGILVVFFIADYYLPEAGLTTKAQELMAYVESLLPPGMWAHVAEKINAIANWLIGAFSNVNQG